jgi:hypothetical protein
MRCDNRVISWFSCGAASAYATWLAAQKYDKITPVYCSVKEEHESSRLFLKQFEEKLKIPVEIIENEKYNGSIYEVFRGTKFIKGPSGAPCTRILKKEMRKAYQKQDDIQVFGYTVEEQKRADRFIDSNNEVDVDFILIDKGITKKQCIEFVKDLGIEIPRMYKLGYSNNNCVGCVKGGMGYWNAIRVDFPEAFNNMAALEREIGHSILKDKDGPVYLDTLDPSRGNFERDMPGDCGFTCEWKQTSFLEETEDAL